MKILAILYWVILLLSLIGTFTFQSYPYFSSLTLFVLLVLIGLKIFAMPIQ